MSNNLGDRQQIRLMGDFVGARILYQSCRDLGRGVQSGLQRTSEKVVLF